ncbi:MAG: DNA phosphorothioation system sulfurtransferase DndC [Chloroflexota bacterium]|nr:DNA phosphorothioation system sulfurtransferase DndC [Chloroflexota bacterium]
MSTAYTDNGVPASHSIAAQLASVREVMQAEYRKNHSDPWIVAYSGGKDSTLLMQLVWEMLLSLDPEDRRRMVYVVANDTLVESPLVIEHLKKSIDVIRRAAEGMGLPIATQITKPYIDQTFWVNVIGRGYIPPTRNFRWCTDRMKIQPTNRLIEELVARHRRAILLVGTRRSESQSRRRNMQKHRVKADKMNPHSSIKGCRMFAPLADLQDDDVWMILMQRKPPWGGSHRNLITLYRNAGGGECPLVLTKEDAPSCGTTSPRFGCWTCTVVTKDRSMRGTIDSGHPEQDKLEALFRFREWLIELREDNANRLPVRRDGRTKTRNDGSRVFGPFTLDVRYSILNRLHDLEDQIGEQLISRSEIVFIEDIWRHDKAREEGRLALIEMLGSESV